MDYEHFLLKVIYKKSEIMIWIRTQSAVSLLLWYKRSDCFDMKGKTHQSASFTILFVIETEDCMRCLCTM